MSSPSSLFDTDAFHRALFFPERRATPPPEGAEDVRVAVDGASLHLRVHAGPAPLVLLFHGNGEVVADYDGAAARFAQAGAALAVVDYRGYGDSAGVPTYRSMLADAHAVLDAVIARGRPLVVMGRSLGGACAAELYRRDRAAVHGYVFESAAADLAGVVRRRGLREAPSARDVEDFDPLLKLAAGTTPALVLHGESDAIIRVEEARRSARALSAGHLVTIPGRGHNDVSEHPRYWLALRELIARVAG